MDIGGQRRVAKLIEQVVDRLRELNFTLGTIQLLYDRQRDGRFLSSPSQEGDTAAGNQTLPPPPTRARQRVSSS